LAVTITEPEIVSRCLLCGSQDYRTTLEEPPYSVRRCRNCGMAWVTPRRDEAGLVHMYSDDSYWRSPSPKSLGYHDYRADEPLYLDTFRRRLGFVLRNGPHGGRALDVGCAAGFCMQALRERGFDTYGVEVSPTIASHAINRLGFDAVHIGSLDGAPFPEGFFDLITLWDVIEHVPDPRALLETAHRLLRPGGLLVLETQDIDSRFARLLGHRWHHFKHPEHIYHFNPSTVRTLLDSARFDVDTLTHRYGGKYVSFDFIAERAGRVHPALSFALRPLAGLRSARVYLNFMDEMVITALPRASN
jgi:2-polyprenyl-3-methyl-5-hydroxy-6-metoxy-1,4-benzoquinol methylase